MPSNSPIPSRRLLLRQSSLFLGGIALAGTDVLDLVESRRGYGIQPITHEVVAYQQDIAETFFKLQLIPNEIDVSTVIWNSQTAPSLTQALVIQPHLLLPDKPLGALDALTRIDMQRLIETLWQEQQSTALLVTHDVEEAVMLGDRVIVIQESRIELDVPVHLPRPRNLADAEINRLKQKVLNQILVGGRYNP